MSADRSLVRQFNLGSKQALRRIFEKYKDDLYTITVSLVGDGHLAEDCLQDVFVHMARAAGRVQVRSNLRGYLAKAAVNRARDCLRRRSRQIDRPVEDMPLAGTTLGPDCRMICMERVYAVLQAVAKLPIEQREVFVLHTQGTLSFREIARHQEISLRTVHSRYRYAVDKLRQLLHEEAPCR